MPFKGPFAPNKLNPEGKKTLLNNPNDQVSTCLCKTNSLLIQSDLCQKITRLIRLIVSF